MDHRLRIQMLGGFDIVSGGNSVAKQVKRSSKIWKLLQYLIANRQKTVSQDELIDIFWPDGNEESPGNAMRTMVYRLRAALVAGGIAGADKLIQYKHGGYAWNSDIDCFIDIEEFESLCQQANFGNLDAEKRLELLLQAESLYLGDFLPNASTEMWAIPIARYYRSMYLKCVHDALKLLAESSRYAESEMLGEKALLLDPFDEKIREYHLQSLLSQGKLVKALDEYKKTEALFYDELGVALSDALRGVYSQIKKLENAEGRKSLDDIMNEWRDDGDFSGAYFCEYEVFKSVFQIEARSLARTGKTVYMICFDINNDISVRTSAVMTQLEQSIPAKLRKGDLFTRTGSSQYILMLQGLTYENCRMLIDRIIRSVSPKYRSLITKTTVRPIPPLP